MDVDGFCKIMKNIELLDFRSSGVHTHPKRVFDAILTRRGGKNSGQDEAQCELR